MRYLLTIIFAAGFFMAKSQDNYLVTLKGDTIFGETSVFSGTAYDQIKVKNSSGKDMYPAFQVQKLVKNDEVFEPIIYNDKRVMAKLLIKGYLSHYAVRKDGLLYSERILYKEEDAFELSSLSFRKRILSYIGDCELLKEKIDKRELGFSDIQEIVSEYNQCKTPEALAAKYEESSEANDFKDLSNFSQLILDINEKVENGEEVPDYMIKSLSKYSGISIDEKVKSLLSKLNKN